MKPYKQNDMTNIVKHNEKNQSYKVGINLLGKQEVENLNVG